ncbi:MAG: methionine--tRNA ligase [Gammaproteobacteria bacterium]|nr:methionine--tRNA ligase [Gammaproteobacteria bacterium]
MTTPRQMLVTSALPYANGPLHLGHLLEHIQTSIWVNTQKMLGHTCLSVCGEDAHGTPIMLKAEQLGITPEALIAEIKISHEKDFKAFGVDYDHYHTTHSEENRELAEETYMRLKDNGDIIKKTILQAFDPIKKMFLPDRYIKGECPRCGASDQYGDNCEACGATYAPTELKNPISALSGTTPVEKESEHYFFDLPKYEAFLKDWTKSGALQTEAANKLDEWFEAGLKPWDISRDEPYFGFNIPGTTDKYFYVWLDAPIGYMASFKKYCELKNIDFDAFWGANATSDLYHFIGKDIMYFHTLFWPAMLKGSNRRLPTAVFTHGFLTINGEKMSKSRGTFIEANHYLEHLNPECLRYFFAAKLNGRVDDLDLNLDEFMNRINADLVGKIVNIASRCAGFVHKRFESKLSEALENPELFNTVLDARESIVEAYLERDYARAIRHILEAASLVNQYIDAEKPWVLAKDPDQLNRVQAICSLGLNLFRLLITYLKPVLPQMAESSEHFLNCEPLTWQNIDTPLLNHTINAFKPLMTRVEQTSLDALIAPKSS